MKLTPRKDRFHVSVELLLLLLVAVRFFDLKPMGWLFDGEGGFFSYMLLLIVIYIRNMGFTVRYEAAGKMTPVWWILVGALISFIPAYRYYGQHLYYSVIVYRPFFGYFALFVLLSVKPTKQELKRALYAFSVIYLVVTLYVTFVKPDLVELQERVDFIQKGDFVHMLSGVEYAVLAFIFALDDFRNQRRMSWPHLLWSLFIFFIVFLPQNRTTIMASFVIVLVATFSGRSASRRLVAEVVMGFFALAVLVVAGGYLMGLVTETVQQLSDPDYNRVKAFTYFTSLPNGWMSIFWGNGFISGYVHPIMAQLMQDGIFYADMGLLGFWFLFGIIPVGTILYYVFRGLSRKHSFLVRANAWFILVGCLTISFFLRFNYSLWLCLFLYLSANDPEYEWNVAMEKKKTEKKALRRYRSIV